MAGAQCCENPPALSAAAGEGRVVKEFGGLKVYVAGSDDSKLAVLLISDIFGYEAPNLRKLADKIAASGYLVIVPDFFCGDPFVPEKSTLQTWLQDHGTDKGFEVAKPIVAKLTEEGISAVGAAGFCWGAKVVAELSKTGEIKAAVWLHPSFVNEDDVKETKAHLSILGAEVDQMSPPSLLKKFEEILAAKSEIHSFVKIFPGVAHGWSVRYDSNDPVAVEKANEAHADLLEWFGKHLTT